MKGGNGNVQNHFPDPVHKYWFSTFVQIMNIIF